MVDVEAAIRDYKSNTASNADKLLRKYKAKVGAGLTKMKTDKNNDHWASQVSSDDAKRKRKAKIGKLTTDDFIKPMEERGVAAYKRATASKTVTDKLAKNALPYWQVAEQVSKDKGEVTDIESGLANVRMLMEAMKKKEKELNA